MSGNSGPSIIPARLTRHAPSSPALEPLSEPSKHTTYSPIRREQKQSGLAGEDQLIGGSESVPVEESSTTTGFPFGNYAEVDNDGTNATVPPDMGHDAFRRRTSADQGCETQTSPTALIDAEPSSPGGRTSVQFLAQL